MKKRFLAFVLSMIILAEVILPGNTLAVDAEEVSCTHHREHTAGCGYVEAVEGHGCTHVCDENCYQKTLTCSHEGGQHDEGCGYAAAVAEVPEAACGHVCGEDCEVQRVECVHTEHDEGCGYAPGAAEIPEVPCSYVHDAAVCGETEENCPHTEHDEDCGYVPAVPAVAETPCTHEHTVECMKTEIVCEHQHDETCGYAPAVPAAAEIPCTHEHTEACCTVETVCGHQHDEGCGYVEAVEGSSCTFVCSECLEEMIDSVLNTEKESLCTYGVTSDENGEYNENCLGYEISVETCRYCGQEDKHLPYCYLIQEAATFGVNEPYRGVGPLAKVETGTAPQVTLFTANPAMAKARTITAEQPKNRTSISTPDGTVNGEKTVTSTGNMTDDNEPIFQINLTAESTSHITGESCDFVMVLDMSYSMTGDNLAKLKEACLAFVEELYKKSEFSRVAIVTYGGNKNANKFYIRSAIADSYVLTVDTAKKPDGTEFTEPESGTSYGHDVILAPAAGTTNQLWYLAYSDDGTMQIQSEVMNRELSLDVYTGEFGPVNNVYSHIGIWTNHNNNSEKWIPVPVEQESSKRVKYALRNAIPDPENKKYGYLNLQRSNIENGDLLLYPKTKNSSDFDDNELWYIEEQAPDYETYYWTNSADTKGYGYYTNDAVAETAFLTISQDNGSKKNEKLINAINALEVYGGVDEGSHPGEAMEKAQKIFSAVGEDDICEETHEKYINCRRGVLFFADGVPTPTDAVSISRYPDGNNKVYEQTGTLYNFLDTYTDVQDALNWARVIKYTRNEVLEDPEVEDEFHSNYYFGDYLPDSRYVGAVGSGASVYVLSINLVALDITVCDKSTHSGKDCIWGTVTLDDNTTKTVCLRKTASTKSGGLRASFDSASNEFFYRLSSHVSTSEHITQYANKSVSQESWHTIFASLTDSQLTDIGATASWRTGAWGFMYSDTVCRNQPGGYFLVCDQVSDLTNIFVDIAIQTGKDLKDLTLTDNVTMAFVITDDKGNPVTEGTRILPDGTVITETTPQGTIDAAPYIGIVYIHPESAGENAGKYYIVWSGFELNPGDADGENAKKFDAKFYVTTREGFLGGNEVPSNEGADLVGPDDNPIIQYPDPEVDIEVSDDKISNITLEARAGSSYLESITYEELLDLITVKVGKTGEEDPSLVLKLAEENYGLENWQNEFVNIKFKLYDTLTDEDGNQLYDEETVPLKGNEITAGGTLNEVRRNHSVIVQIWVWSKIYDNGAGDPTDEPTDIPPEGAHTAVGVVTIRVHYPTFIFADETLYYGQSISEMLEPWEQMSANKYLYWYTDDEYDQMKINENEKSKFTVEDIKAEGFKPLAGSGNYTGIGDEPSIYFKVNPIDSIVPSLSKVSSSVDNSFYEKYGHYMLKQDIAMNVRVYFGDVDAPLLDDPLRHAFFLHADHDSGTTSCENVAIHTSGGLVVDENNVPDPDYLLEYWLPEFYIHAKTCQMTIKKTGGIPGETYVFDIWTDAKIITDPNNEGLQTGMTEYTSVSITVDEEGVGEVTIYEMPVGDYQVVENMDWSWRFDQAPSAQFCYDDIGVMNAVSRSVTLYPEEERDAVTILFANQDPVKNWLSGMSTVVKNIFGIAGNIENSID